jgi:hypothetical protein
MKNKLMQVFRKWNNNLFDNEVTYKIISSELLV